jgi:hypothetical protein
LAVAVEVAVEELEAAGVLISPDDLAVVIDAIGACVLRTRKVDRLVVVVAVQEAMGDAVGVKVITNDLAFVVDAEASVPSVPRGSLSVL